jgi:hypothetical protein
MSQQTDFLDELSGSSIGGIQTDHGGITIGDIFVLILDFVLLIYTGWRSYDFLTTTVPTGWEMLALVGLWGLDIGAVFWSLTWIFGSTGKFQNWTSLTLFLIDLAGAGLTGLTDSLMYGSEGVMTEALSGITRVAVPVVMFINVVAGFIYHMTSPQTKERRKMRELEAEHAERMREVRQAQMRLTFTQAQLLARQETVEVAQIMAQIKVAQDRIEQEARRSLRDNRMSGAQSQLNRLTGALNIHTSDEADDLDALRQQISLLSQRPAPYTPKPANKPGLFDLLKEKIGGAKGAESGVRESDLTDLEEVLRQQLEQAEQTRKMVEAAKGKIDEPMLIPSPIEEHPKAGSNGGHSLDPTTAG